MAIIAIFCDGTWNSFNSPDETHVARFAKCCARTEDQSVVYISGVGAGTGFMSALGRTFDKIGGGLFGWGLNRNILAAYREICAHHRPGDKIMIFGFSRGAYTARSLVGLIRKSGILADPTPQNLQGALQLYRKRGPRNMPDARHIREARRILSPHYATSPTDVILRDDESVLVRISYVGVWDTVGALGIPRTVLGPVAGLWNRRYAFHDTSLSGLVEHARHAVALDEKRVLFQPSLWDNLDDSGPQKGLNNGDASDARRYQQKWFVGSHSIVGGSVAPKGLAMASLNWIGQGARAAGLRLKEGATLLDAPINMAAEAPELYRLGWLYRAARWLVRWRDGPARSQQLHDTARLRATLVATYRPHTLRRVLPNLF